MTIPEDHPKYHPKANNKCNHGTDPTSNKFYRTACNTLPQWQASPQGLQALDPGREAKAEDCPDKNYRGWYLRLLGQPSWITPHYLQSGS